jgi:four helix bundle protein
LLNKKFLELQDINAYRIAFELSNYVWNIVLKWNYFAKDTVGKQLVKAIDSISANIAEGFGRYFKKDKINFYRYSYGSIDESSDWIEKANKRDLLKQKEYQHISDELKRLPREINHLISFTNEKLSI